VENGKVTSKVEFPAVEEIARMMGKDHIEAFTSTHRSEVSRDLGEGKPPAST